MVSRSYFGREELVATLTLGGGLQVSADKSEILNFLAKVMGARTLPIDALSLSADGMSGRLTAIRKPPSGELALGFVPMFLNKERVAQIHYYLAGERGAALRDLVDEALLSHDPGLLEKALDGIRLLFGRELSDEKWARQFLQPQEGQGPEVMQMTSVVIDELDNEVPGVKSNLAYYAAAVELSGGSSGISLFDDKRQ